MTQNSIIWRSDQRPRKGGAIFVSREGVDHETPTDVPLVLLIGTPMGSRATTTPSFTMKHSTMCPLGR
nr:hypothetical protein [Pseudarthrobacter sp. NS4]